MIDGKRELLIGAVGLVKGTVRNGGRAMVAVCDELEPEFERTKFLQTAPFGVVSIILHFGTQWGLPSLGKINKRYSELDVTIEMPMARIRLLNEIELTEVVKKATLEVLVDVAEKYDLDGDVWEKRLNAISCANKSGAA